MSDSANPAAPPSPDAADPPPARSSSMVDDASPLRAASPAAIFATPEVIAALMLVALLAIAGTAIPHFLSADYLLDRATIDMEAGLLAIAMTFVIGAGHIDLSCASMMVLTAAIVAKVHSVAGVPLLPLVILAPLIGGLLGALNGIIVTRLGLPSLIVTLATLALYRGLTRVLLPDASIKAPDWFRGFDQMILAGWIPAPVIVFIVAAVVMGFVLHKSVFGRYVLAIGTNPEAALYSGVPVDRTVCSIFILSGMAAGAAAMMIFSRLGVARGDAATGMELDVVTAVVLGGANIFGGRATVAGSAIALLLIFVLHAAMGLKNISPSVQNGAVGALLIAAVLISIGIARLRGLRTN